MLFNTTTFIFAFLPLAVLGCHFCQRIGGWRLAELWLIFASFLFYGWWNWRFLFLLAGSIVINYLIANVIRSRQLAGSSGRSILIAGVTLNLMLLAVFKYAGFLIGNIESLFGQTWAFPSLVLPLAISFYSFQQIAFLVDTQKQVLEKPSFASYTLFVSFFPQLIAGPIVHHQEMMPQFKRSRGFSIRANDVAIGITIFTIGLFKKAVIADGIAPIADAIFFGSGTSTNFLEAWIGALAFTFQLYFDFSGYSDMALGIARIFGIQLPLNFYSPYRSTSIIEFWRRWHMTLSRFLRDYLYYPLGGNRKGPQRRYVNVFVTMLIGGLWHGAAWSFVAWGAIHGALLILNHAWRHITRNVQKQTSSFMRVIYWLLTFFAVTVAWVPFRAESIDDAFALLTAMSGMQGILLPLSYGDSLARLGLDLHFFGVRFVDPNTLPNFQGVSQLGHFLVLFFIVLFVPNSMVWMRRYPASIKGTGVFVPRARSTNKWQKFVEWRPTAFWAVFTAGLAIASLLSLSDSVKFLYYQF